MSNFLLIGIIEMMGDAVFFRGELHIVAVKSAQNGIVIYRRLISALFEGNIYRFPEPLLGEDALHTVRTPDQTAYIVACIIVALGGHAVEAVDEIILTK